MILWMSLILLSESSFVISTFFISFSWVSDFYELLIVVFKQVVGDFFFFISVVDGIVFSLLATKLNLGFNDILARGVVDVVVIVVEHMLWLRTKLLLLLLLPTELCVTPLVLNGLPKTFFACEIEYKSAPLLLYNALYIVDPPLLMLPFSSMYLFSHWIVSRLSWYLALDNFYIYLFIK